MSTETAQQLVIFKLADEEYALPIAHVHEIIRFTAPRAVASRDPSVRGVISLRGRVIPVYDLSTRLGTGGAGVTEGKIVIVEADGTVAGVVVDDVEEVVTIDAAQLDAEGGRDVVGLGVEAIVKLDTRLIVLLDPVSLVHSPAGEVLAQQEAGETAGAAEHRAATDAPTPVAAAA